MNYNECTLPEFKSHKKVKAAKFSRIESDISNDSFHLLCFDDKGNDFNITVDKDTFIKRFPAIDQDGYALQDGYLVIYQDGFISWSPKNAFEIGYTDVRKFTECYFSEELEKQPLDKNKTFEEQFTFLDKTVYPSKEKTIEVIPDKDYDGAHVYRFTNSVGFNNGKAEYVKSKQGIKFVQKNEDGSMEPGIQSEQLLIALIDRHKKLNNKFHSIEGAMAISKMEEALNWLEMRVEKRITRGVMGQLKK